MNKSTDKTRAVETAMGQIERQFGKGSIMKLGNSKIIDVPAISTGSLALDSALGIGGQRAAAACGGSAALGAWARAKAGTQRPSDPSRR